MRTVSPNREGGSRRAAIAISVAMAVMIGATLLASGSVRQLEIDAGWVAHTHEVRTELRNVLAQINHAESSQRGFLLTGDTALLESGDEARAALERGLATLRVLTRDNDFRQAQLDTLHELVNRRLSLLDQVDASRARESATPNALPAWRRLVASGSLLTSEIESLVVHMERFETELLQPRSDAVRINTRATILASAAGAFLALLMAVSSVRTIRDELRERRRVEDELRESEARFRRLSDVSPDGIVVSVDGRVVDVNRAFCDMFGYTEVEAIGRSLLDFTTPDERDMLRERIAAREDGSYECVGLRSDDMTFPIGIHARYAVHNGEPARLSVVRDLTQRHILERMKSEFVSTVSHELRTPLTSIRGSLGLIEGGAAGVLAPRGADLVRIARTNCDRLIRLINDILDVEKLEAGKVELHITSLDPREIIRGTLESVQGFAIQRNVRLTGQIEHAGYIAGDRDRIIQVLTNLLSNAINYSPAGEEVVVTAREAGEGRLRIAVEDHGQGIPADKLPLLFAKFAQLDSSDTRAKGGTGLGLAISRKIIAQHGGDMGVESEVGRFSRFWFEVPLSEHAVAVDIASDSPTRRVLIVEDQEDLVRVTSRLLAREGYAVTRASTVAEALERVNEQSFSAVLLDASLPDGTGLDFLELVRERRPDLNLPVVVVSGHDDDGTFQVPQMVDWLPKPFDKTQLLHALRRAVRRPGVARTLVVDDDAGTRAIISAQLRALGIDCMEAEDGAQAVILFRDYEPDLVILDVAMPRLDGFGFVEMLRREKLQSVPLVVYSGRDLSSAERRTLTLGATRHLTKARESEEQFISSVRELLSGLVVAA